MEKMTLRNVLVAVVEGKEITEEIKTRAQAELDAIDRKNERAKVRRANKQAEATEARNEALDACVNALENEADGLTLEELAKRAGVTPQKIQNAIKADARFERVMFKVSKTDSNGKKRTADKVGYKLMTA